MENQKKRRQEIDSKDTGRRLTESGTDWPIEHYLHRVQLGSRPTWLVTLEVCNGVAENAVEFRSLRAAREYFDKLR